MVRCEYEGVYLGRGVFLEDTVELGSVGGNLLPTLGAGGIPLIDQARYTLFGVAWIRARCRVGVGQGVDDDE